ncbi:hypothetical protein EVU91_04370 [Macrococcoides bohemicum]|uniref:hypothetical protein n=1 Tax=Macrococcoides bohemicum TaxID=1903056 RepID=UPI00105A58B5|nr:hypothetical protein [Macrococcus bohemicus]TDL39385.1 hypothetical protein EVU91_04370 [Macrococcus bohemicus]
MDKNFIARIMADISNFKANIAKAQAAAKSLQDEVTVNVDADTSAATAQISRFRAMLKSIPNKFRVRADVDTSAASRMMVLNRAMASVSKASDGLRSKIGLLPSVFLALAPAIIPILASIVPAIMAIGNALAVVGGGAIGLAGAFGILYGGLGLFAGMAMSATKMLNDGLLESTKETKNFQTALSGLKSQWQGLIKGNQAQIFNTMANGIKIAQAALTGLTPFIKGVSVAMEQASQKMLVWTKASTVAQNFFNMMKTTGVTVFNDLLSGLGRFGDGALNIFTQFGPLFDYMANGFKNMSTQFQAWANSVGTSNGIKTFIEYTKTNLPVIGQIFGDTFMGIFNLFRAFGTNSQTIFQALAEMTTRFRAWSETVGQTNGFKQFIDYVQTQGPVVISAIGSIVNALVAFGTAMAPIGAAVLGMVTSFAQWITGMMQAHPVITMVIGAVVAFTGAVLQIIPIIKTVWNVLTGLWTAFNLLRTGLQIVAAAFTVIASPALVIVAALTAVGIALYLLWTKCETFRNGVMILVAVMQTLGSAIMSGLGTALSYIGTQLTLVIAQVIAFGSQLVTSIGTAMSGLGSAISSGMSVAVSFVTSGFTNMLSIGSSIMNSLLSVASSIFSSIVSAISSAISSAVSFVSSGFSNMLSIASSIMSSISSAVSSAFSMIVSFISSGISSALSFVSSGFSSMMSAASSFASNLISTITSAMSSFVSAISSGASQAISAITTMISNILSAVRGAAIDMVSAGADLVRGFINGIQKMAGEAVKAAGKMASDAVAQVKSFLKIGSPSKVLKQIGEWLTEGFAIGIEKKIPKVRTAVDRMLDPVRKGIAKLKTADYGNAKDGASSVYSLMIKNMNEATKQIEQIADKRKSLMDKIKETQKEMFSAKTAKGKLTKSKELSKLKAQFASLTKQAKKMYKVRKVNRDLKYEIRPMLIYMSRLAKKREQIAAKLDKAKDKLQAAIDKRTDFKNMIKDDLKGYASITNTGRRTSQGMVKMMTKRLAEIKKYQALIGSLKKRGLNKDTLKEILDAGIEQGSVIAKGLFAGGQEAISQVNSLQAQINKAANTMGTANADHFYKAGVDAARGIVKGLQAQDKALKAIADKLAKTISDTIKKRLKIKSPSRVMMAIGGFVGAGLVNSLTTARKKVADASSKIATAIERNVKPDVALSPFDVSGGVKDMKRSVNSTLDADINNGVEVPKQNITVVIKSEHDIPMLKHTLDNIDARYASVNVMQGGY